MHFNVVHNDSAGDKMRYMHEIHFVIIVFITQPFLSLSLSPSLSSCYSEREQETKATAVNRLPSIPRWLNIACKECWVICRSRSHPAGRNCDLNGGWVTDEVFYGIYCHEETPGNNECFVAGLSWL